MDNIETILTDALNFSNQVNAPLLEMTLQKRKTKKCLDSENMTLIINNIYFTITELIVVHIHK